MNLTDSLNNLKQDEVSVAAFQLIDHLQQLPPALQVQAITCVFFLTLDVLEINPRSEFTRAEAIMGDAEMRFDTRFNALRDYIKGEIKSKFTL